MGRSRRTVFQDVLRNVSPKREVKAHAEVLKLLYEISSLRKSTPPTDSQIATQLEAAWNEAVLMQEGRLRREIVTTDADRALQASVRLPVSSAFIVGAMALPMVMQFLLFSTLPKSGWGFWIRGSGNLGADLLPVFLGVGFVCARFLGKRLTDPQSLWADERLAETRAAQHWVFVVEVLVAIAYIPWGDLGSIATQRLVRRAHTSPGDAPASTLLGLSVSGHVNPPWLRPRPFPSLRGGPTKSFLGSNGKGGSGGNFPTHQPDRTNEVMQDPSEAKADLPGTGRLRPFGMDIILPGSQTPPEAAGPTAAKPLAGRI